jgi:diaminopimelate decarboxylase
MESLRFLSADEVRTTARDHGTPVYVYDEATLRDKATQVLAFPNAYGLTARYAMKALPTAAVVQVLTDAGLSIDASSGFEAERALRAGVAPEKIQITAQELPRNLKELIDKGILFNACSMNQLRAYGALFPGNDVSVRVNPGLGSGHSNRTNVGGPSSSFGIWHEHLDAVKAIAAEHRLRITGMHTHIGSGADPDAWARCASLSLGIVEQLPDVTRLSLGGGFKVGRMIGEISADMAKIGTRVTSDFEAFAQKHGRELHLEVEPGTFLVANAGTLIGTVMDIVDTGSEGYTFLKIDAGMTEIVRPSMYGAQHPIIVVPQSDEERGQGTYLITGHCCESGDILTPEPGNPEGLAPREVCEAKVGDYVVIEGAGAYCASMASKNYNAFPECAELMRGVDGTVRVIRKRQELSQLLQNEIV